MIGLDTNVLVRHIVRDDERQAATATKLIEAHCTPEEPGIVTLIVLCELVWVLSQGYRYDRSLVARVVRKMLSADDLQVERSELAWRALHYYEKGKGDLADYLMPLCGQELGAEITCTFDPRTSDCGLFKIVG